MSKFYALLCFCLLCLFTSGTGADSTDEYCQMIRKARPNNNANYLVLIDTSYKDTKPNKNLLVKGLLRIHERLNVFDRLTVKTMDVVGTDGTLLFDRCLPACPDPTILDEWGLGKCDTMQVKKDELNFRRGLLTLSVNSVGNPTFNNIKPDLIRTLSNANKNYPHHRNFTLFSYMIHQDVKHRPRTADDFDSLFFDVVTSNKIPNLDNRLVTIFGISVNDAPNQVDLLKLRQFWEDMFHLAGSQLLAFGRHYQ